MLDSKTRKLTLAGILVAAAVLGGVFSFPVLGSRCAPMQHLVNILAAVFLGPLWGVGVAFSASVLRNIAGLGSLMAFPGSMIGALLCAGSPITIRNVSNSPASPRDSAPVSSALSPPIPLRPSSWD